MNIITVLDYTTSTVKVYEFDEVDGEIIEDFLVSMGHSLSSCEWMSGTTSIESNVGAGFVINF